MIIKKIFGVLEQKCVKEVFCYYKKIFKFNSHILITLKLSSYMRLSTILGHFKSFIRLHIAISFIYDIPRGGSTSNISLTKLSKSVAISTSA